MSYPPPTPAHIHVSHTAKLPAGSQPISDTIGLLSGAARVVLPPAPVEGSAVEEDLQFPLAELKAQALAKLKEAARQARASGILEAGFVVEVRCEGVGVLTVDTL
ncbi:hypothetical protein JCM10213_000924 [Rhodosporidiobolus nylandii]